MKGCLKIVGVLFLLGALAVTVSMLMVPWMNRWGATEAELAATYSGDELVPVPAVGYTRAITVDAPAEEIYPWIVQLGAGKGGMYSYDWFETNILQCPLVNADSIHPEWQDLKVGDKVKMCPQEDFGPPPYEVALIEPDRAVVMGHFENGKWVDIWQFVLVPQPDGTTRLLLRSRDMKTGGIWELMRPGEFIMMRGMMLGIKERAEG